MNKLFYGDCLGLMNNIPEKSIDLIYLDPPFNSNRMYNAIYTDNTGRPLPELVNAFSDMWKITTYQYDLMNNLPKLVKNAGLDTVICEYWQYWFKALEKTDPKLLSYLLYMMERLLKMKPLLKDTGSIYYHCDPTASHYIKIMMDTIFGKDNFRNEIVWCYTGPGITKKQFKKKHDIIFWYSNTNKWIFNYNSIRIPYKKDISYIPTIGGKWKKEPFSKKQIEQYRQQGKIPEDWWEITTAGRSKKEYIGYPTQKPLKLLKRIIQASTNEGDVVLDPFCGCATTICAAHELKRKWIGIDIAYHAIKKVTHDRLKDKYHLLKNKDYTIDGIPNTLEGAIEIWNKDKYQFQRWVIEFIGGYVSIKQTADGGIDGRIYFKHPDKKELMTMSLEVKGGKNITPSIIRDLRGVMERENYPMAGLVLLHDLKPLQLDNFNKEMASAGKLIINGKKYDRMQILTTNDILNGKRFDMPAVANTDTGQEVLI